MYIFSEVFYDSSFSSRIAYDLYESPLNPEQNYICVCVCLRCFCLIDFSLCDDLFIQQMHGLQQIMKLSTINLPTLFFFLKFVLSML